MSTGNERPLRVGFHFDVMCPFAYQTSLWIREVRRLTGLEIDWRFFSLEEVNRVDGKKHPWEREWSYGWSMMRIGALLRRTDMALVDEWYLRAATALHVHGHKPHDPAVARHLLAEMGVDPSLVDDAISDPTTHDEVRADHDAVIAAGGYGVPTLCFEGTNLSEGGRGHQADAEVPQRKKIPTESGTNLSEGGRGHQQWLFGPVVLDPPMGDAALRLWSAVTAWLEFPHLYELQRPKTVADGHYIAETFRPYLEARDWVSIDRGEQIDFGSYDPKAT